MELTGNFTHPIKEFKCCEYPTLLTGYSSYTIAYDIKLELIALPGEFVE
jgi:hypothetical protein